MARGKLLVLLAVLALAPPASAAVRQAGSVLPPGQSGFVSAAGLTSGTGSPHLQDQTSLFLNFDFKPSGFGQPGATEEPKAGVKIVRDKFGMPAVTGATEADAWFGAGYAVAQDRMFQLELFRRATQGRLAEILGKDYVDDDIVARRDYYTGPELDAFIAKARPDLLRRTEAYRDGINAWFAEARLDPSKLPGEFAAVGALPIPDWTLRDSASVGVFLARTVPSGDGLELDNARALKGLGSRIFDKLLPLRVPGQVGTVPPENGAFPGRPGRTRKQEQKAYVQSRKFVDGLHLPARDQELAGSSGIGGSNMWAVKGAAGGATLFNGPQLGYSIPELFVELEVHGPGLDVRGFTAPGVPVIGLGHNGKVAWGLTSGLSDEDDLYAEELKGEESYEFKG
ncbi:MAG: penicillin acylase family protein, partial [Thermoleophilaceae bacterium]|nr:penicillin acylase family protein [Thermoleophilaceae bacterium]